MTTTQNCMSAEEIITGYRERWDSYSTHRFRNLLRIALLRELARGLHSEKSACLAKGLRNDARTLGTWEKQIEELRDRADLNQGLPETIADTTAKKRSRILPEAIFSIIEREKLERFDRLWEAALISEGLQQGWSLWSLDLRVQISFAEQSNKELNQKLFPNGLVLFAESMQLGPNVSSSPEFWNGRWYVMLDSALGKPDSRLNIAGIDKSSEPPRWKLLFSAKKS
jgi:predicted transcriptional regulator